MMGRFAVAASGREATDTPDGVAESQARCKCVASGERRHVVLSDIPSGRREGADQSPGEHPTRLQCAETKYLAGMCCVDAPIVNDVKHLRPDDSEQDYENPEIPRMIGIDSLFLRVADADPQPDEDAERDQQPIRGHIEIADMKKSGEHF